MSRCGRLLVLISVMALVMTTAIAAMAGSWERADLHEQGEPDGGDVLVEDGVKIHRTAKGVTASVSMPTPEPESYNYPTTPTSSGEAGHPEAFTLWVFIFFNPEECDGDCDGPDLQTNLDVVAGAFNAGGHLVGGPNLTISGHVNPKSTLFGGPNAETLGEALDDGFELDEAEIHVAVAPHGALDPELLPEQTSTPAGDASFWWAAFFK